MNESYSWVCFQSLRGMKELDLFLQKFNNSHYIALSREMKEDYHQLLKEQDGSLWDWFFHLSPPPNQYADIIRLIAPWHP
jgi:succinate dehydrogenase flavin-adding protein (antitoxin of CptAB toxin-antitoxin module)